MAITPAQVEKLIVAVEGPMNKLLEWRRQGHPPRTHAYVHRAADQAECLRHWLSALHDDLVRQQAEGASGD